MDRQSGSPVDPLLDALSGKRAHPRRVVSLDVELGGPANRVHAKAVEVSGGGTLLRLTSRTLEALRRRPSQDLASVLQGAFPDGPDIHFVEAGVTVSADLTRLMLPERDGSPFLVGCRFQEALSLAQLTRLGVAPVANDEEQLGLGIELPWTEPSPFDALPWVPRRPGAVSALLFDASHTALGRRYHARVHSLGPHAITAQVDGADLHELTSALGAGPFAFRVVAGADSWSARGTLVATRYIDAPGGAVAVALVTTERPTRRLRRAFQRRSTR